MSVVHLKPRKPAHNTRTDLEAIDATLGVQFVRLGERYGAHAVVTVALTYVTQAIRQTRRKGHPIGQKWLEDLRCQFDRAMKGEP